MKRCRQLIRIFPKVLLSNLPTSLIIWTHGICPDTRHSLQIQPGFPHWHRVSSPPPTLNHHCNNLSRFSNIKIYLLDPFLIIIQTFISSPIFTKEQGKHKNFLDPFFPSTTSLSIFFCISLKQNPLKIIFFITISSPII